MADGLDIVLTLLEQVVIYLLCLPYFLRPAPAEGIGCPPAIHLSHLSDLKSFTSGQLCGQLVRVWEQVLHEVLLQRSTTLSVWLQSM